MTATSGDIVETIDALIAALDTNPSRNDTLQMLFQLADANPELCSAQMERRITANPQRLQLRAIAAALYLRLGRRKEEIAQLEMLDRSNVRSEDFCLQYATALYQTEQVVRALALCNKGLESSPHSVGLLKLRSSLFIAQKKHDLALKDLLQCVALAPDDSTARMRLGCLKLLISDCKEGFEELSAYRDIEIAAKGSGLSFSIPEWQGEPLAEKRLLVWANQGVGDIMMFASFLPWILSQGAAVTLALYPKLMPLFARSFPGIDVVCLATDTATRYGSHSDYHLPFSQLTARVLPHYVPANHPAFLKADAERANALREKYRALHAGGVTQRLVGVSWFTTSQETSKERNIPLAQWDALFSVPGVQFVTLQHGDRSAEIASVQHRFPQALHSDPSIDAYEDIDGLAAQIAAMDEVISIDNSTVHLAGALGVPVTLLLNASSDWRWGLTGTGCRWYQSLKIERQEELFNWQPVMRRQRKRLMALIRSNLNSGVI